MTTQPPATFFDIPNVFDINCPTRLVLDRIADKWALLILRRLTDGPLRFNKLHRDLQGISHKVLSQTLKKLERDGMITREVFATVPATVEYSVTPLGETLSGTIKTLTHWAEENIAAIMAAQKRYDARKNESG